VQVRFQWASIAAAGFLLAACAAPQRAGKPKGDPAKDAAYAEAVAQLADLDRLGDALLKGGLTEDAAAAVTKGQPLQVRLLAAPRPTLEAMEAVADLDDLYARMLLADHHDGFARMLYEKNRARWKSWKPQSGETARRLREAEAGMAECDRRLKR
jgi:hypothetical protein